jgi:hypothetical protein
MLTVREMDDGRWMAIVQYQKAKLIIYRSTREAAQRCGTYFLPPAQPASSEAANANAPFTAPRAQGEL